MYNNGWRSTDALLSVLLISKKPSLFTFKLLDCLCHNCGVKAEALVFLFYFQHIVGHFLRFNISMRPKKMTFLNVFCQTFFLLFWHFWFWGYVIIMSGMSFRVNLRSIVCVNVKDLLVGSRRHIWSLSDNNTIRTHNHLVCKRKLNHLANLAKRFQID